MPAGQRQITMNTELAQIIALITHGNEHLLSPGRDGVELFPSHSTFQHVSEISFQGWESDVLRKPRILARDPRTWFSFLEAGGVQYLKLDLLNLNRLPPPYATSISTAGNAWVIQTDQGKCWQARWLFQTEGDPHPGRWQVAYQERENLPVLTDLPDSEVVYHKLKNSLLEARAFSLRWNFGWDDWFGEAINLLQASPVIQPYYNDLFPEQFENVKVRQLLAGALKAWVFGRLGSWNDMYITSSKQEQEYQRISRNLYSSVIQAVVTATNSTADTQLLLCSASKLGR